MPLLLVALFLFTAVQAAAESLPTEEQSGDPTQIPSAADILRKDDQGVIGPLESTPGDVSDFLLQELNKRGPVEPLAPSILVLPGKPDE
jgi:hypothetical protein